MSTDIRAELANLMQATLKESANWTYRAIRPLDVPYTWKPGQHVIADCSKAVQYLCRWARARDPMGSNFGQYGNSQTIWSHLQHLADPSELLVGDIITFGINGDEHATMVLKPGTDPLLWSFGHQGAPDTYLLSEDHRTSQYCRMPIPTYTPTPQDKLRAMTGWFAWVAWRLGEGDWKPFGRTNRMVRPNVPVIIPLSWWRDLVAFLRARNRGNPPTK